MTAIWFGLVTWLAELIVQLLRTAGGAMHLIYPRVLVLGPVAYVLFFLLIGLMLFGLRRLWPGPLPPAVAIGSIVFASTTSVVAIFLGKLGVPSAVILAGGVSVHLTRMILANQLSFEQMVRRTFLPVALVAILPGASWYAGDVVKERFALGRAGQPPPGAPNVVLVSLDTVRASSLSVYGADRPTTPFLEEIAREGVRFDWAIASAPWTIPSHGSMFTGLPAADLLDDTEQPIPGSATTLAEVLRELGYSTGAFVANLHFMARDTGLNQGFMRYSAFRLSWEQLVLSFQPGRSVTNSNRLRKRLGFVEILNRKPAAEITREFTDWLDGLPSGPFFAFLNYYDAHEPYLPPEPFRTRFDRPEPGFRFNYWYDTYRVERRGLNQAPPEPQLLDQLGAYEGQIARLDSELRHLVQELRERGLLDNTLLVITADHGEAFGEHGLLGHFNNVHVQSLRVPLLMWFPGRVPPGTVVRTPAALTDLPATMMDVAGLGGRFTFPGQSLARRWRSPARSLAPVSIESTRFGHDSMRSRLAWPYHYVSLRPGHEELYDLSRDPHERRNLATRSEYRPMLDRLRHAVR